MTQVARSLGFVSARGLVYTIVAAALLALLFVVLRPDKEAPTPETVKQTATYTTELNISGNSLPVDRRVIQVEQGVMVTLYITSDREDEFHPHGYNLKTALKPPTRATLQFQADKAGRFEFELHQSHTELGALEVYPR